MATREIVISNRQRTRKLDAKQIRQLCDWIAGDGLGFDEFELGVHFVGAKRMAEVHQQFMNIPGSTDVITFDHGSKRPLKIYGEIFISVEDAIAQAREFRTTWQEEVARYLIHGVLHLAGCDDMTPPKRKQMKRIENQTLRRMRNEFDLTRIEKI
jgi:probable rRNA maturation factor